MLRKKTPLLRASPSVLQSSCSTKLSNPFSLTRSPGPFLSDNSPSFVTSHFDAIRFGSALLIDQPLRSLPLKSGLVSKGRNLRLRSSIMPSSSRERWHLMEQIPWSPELTIIFSEPSPDTITFPSFPGVARAVNFFH